jgi:hypothetical protein
MIHDTMNSVCMPKRQNIAACHKVSLGIDTPFLLFTFSFDLFFNPIEKAFAVNSSLDTTRTIIISIGILSNSQSSSASPATCSGSSSAVVLEREEGSLALSDAMGLEIVANSSA